MKAGILISRKTGMWAKEKPLRDPKLTVRPLLPVDVCDASLIAEMGPEFAKGSHDKAPCADQSDIVGLSLSDEDFGKLVAGKTQAQRLFMAGKLKVKGNVMKVNTAG